MRQLTATELAAIEREYCKRSLASFTKRAWRHFDPEPYVHGWHMDAIAEHLEACARGEITRLLINIPPGTSKSTETCVVFPAWLWGPFGWPSCRFIGASYEQGLATRDNRRTRQLVESEWYQKHWPIGFASDQNEKTYFENLERGFRQASAVKSMTGRRGDFVVWDDPLSPEKANSEVDRETANRIFSETLPSRLIDPKKSVIIIIMQRLHENDVSGYILSRDLGYEHLCLPMEFEPDRRCVTSIGWSDPRTEEGELLFPERFPREVVERDKAVMGSFAVAGQLQQRPVPRGGGLFKRHWFQIVRAAPAGCKWVRAWDFAGTAENERPDPDYTVGLLLGVDPEGRLYVADVVRDRLSPSGVDRLTRNVAGQDGTGVAISIPQDPGQAGKSQAQYFVRQLAGYRVRATPETGSKVTRAEPVSAQAEAGNVFLVEGPWNETFLDEVSTFPNGAHDDQVDALSRAFAEVVGGRKGAAGIVKMQGGFY